MITTTVRKSIHKDEAYEFGWNDGLEGKEKYTSYPLPIRSAYVVDYNEGYKDGYAENLRRRVLKTPKRK